MTRDHRAEIDDVESKERVTRSEPTGGRTDRTAVERSRASTRDGDTGAALPAWSRRDVVKAGALAGIGTVGARMGASAPAAAQPASEIPSYEQAADDLSHPDPSEEVVALYRYLHDVWGEGVLSGQQYEPWGIDEMDHVESVTGQLPAVQGADFIHDDKSQPIDQALDWWDRGGITAIMWHWGVPGLELQDEYEESRDQYIENENYDVSQVLEEGTDANDAFWAELEEVADQLEVLRDDGVPIVWRPFHEFDGTWFWWGMEGADFFIELWETMHEYFVEERDLDNLLWLLPHSHSFDASWVPDASTYDLGGADGYPGGPGSQSATYDTIVSTHGDRPPIFHECGTPLDPDAIERDDAWWTMWIVWHTDWLTDTEDSFLDEVYNHEFTVNLEDLPDIVGEYGDDQTSSCGSDADAQSLSNGQTVCDLGGDGAYTDVNGDGSVTNTDVTEFFSNQHVDPWDSRPDLFDFTGDDEVTQADVIELFEYVSGS